MLSIVKRTNGSPSRACFHASRPGALLEPERDASFFFQALASAHPTPGSDCSLQLLSRTWERASQLSSAVLTCIMKPEEISSKPHPHPTPQ